MGLQRNQNPNNLPVELNRTSLYLGLLFVFVTDFAVWRNALDRIFN